MNFDKEYSIDVAPDFLKGYTPIKGVDYFTETEKSQFIEEVTNRVNSVITPEEETRSINEEQREANEKERIKAENTRVSQETTRQENETLRQNNEEIRLNDEETRKANEQNRISAEQNRTATFDAQIVKNENAINDIKDKISEYNENATEKTNAFNDNATAKTNQYNSNYSSTLEEFNMNAQNKIDEYNENAKPLTDEIEVIKAKNIEQTTEIEVLKAENAIFRSQIPSETVVEETVHLEDSSNMQCQITPLGASKQETREGYNLLPNKATTQTINGVTFTVNKDGSILANGTANSNAILNIYSDLTLKLGSTYKINGCATGGSEKTYRLLFSDSSFKDNTADTGSGATLTTTTENKYMARIIVYSGATVNNVLFKPMIVVGTEEKPYEQYGASPSIEYESPIESVGDNINLFDGIFNRHDIANDTGIEQSFESENHLLTANYIEVKSNTDYTLSFNHIFSANTGITKIMEYDKDHNFITRNSASSKTNIITFKTSGNCHYIRVGIFDAGGISETNLKLEKGTKATPYSPYGQGSIEIYNENKNFFDKNNVAYKNAYLNDNGNLGNEVSDWIATDTFIPVKPNTEYVVSATSMGERFIYVEYTDKIYSAIIGKRNEITPNTAFTTSSTAKYIRFCTNNPKATNIQLEKGSKPTDYTPHQSQTKVLHIQQPLREIGDVKDRFVKQNGVWYEEHKIKRIIFDGTENWYQSASNGLIRFQTRQIKDMLQQANRMPIYSNYLRYASTGDFIGLVFAYYIENGSIYLYPPVEITTVELMEKWLANLSDIGTPLYVDYVLATPRLIECTPEQVEVLESFNTYKNVTNISSDSIGELEVFYYKDLETLLNK